MTEVGKKSGEIWREMDGEEKKIWEGKAKDAKEKYDDEYKEWLETGGSEAIKQVICEEKKIFSGKLPFSIIKLCFNKVNFLNSKKKTIKNLNYF